MWTNVILCTFKTFYFWTFYKASSVAWLVWKHNFQWIPNLPPGNHHQMHGLFTVHASRRGLAKFFRGILVRMSIYSSSILPWLHETCHFTFAAMEMFSSWITKYITATACLPSSNCYTRYMCICRRTFRCTRLAA